LVIDSGERGGGGSGGCEGGFGALIAHHWANLPQMGPYYRMIALVFAIACLFELSGTRGIVLTTWQPNGLRGSNGGGGSGGSGSSGGCLWRSGTATHTAHDWAVNSQPWPYQGMIALTIAITSTFFCGT